ncbi:hypothetical protein PS898_00804 [Pseudomonas fluorescens]|nr:hypothetical protein PS898_00804 [Pseudomonas fluorescens]
MTDTPPSLASQPTGFSIGFRIFSKCWKPSNNKDRQGVIDVIHRTRRTTGQRDFRWAQDHSEPWLAQAASIDTDVAQYFLVSARCGCFMQAARSLNVRSTLLRKQLAQLEQQLQHTLFSFQGCALSLPVKTMPGWR